MSTKNADDDLPRIGLSGQPEPEDHASTGDGSSHAGSRRKGTHTPGPWQVSGHLGTWIQTAGDPYGYGGMHIADVRGWGHLTGGGACNLEEDSAIAIQTANAQLIAAAPELLAMLVRVQKYFFEFPRQVEHADAVLRDVTAAIAKAEGR